jgi:flagellum-specific peptidoglycan hydrolase FlgJ
MYDNVAASYIDHAKFFIDRNSCQWPYSKSWQTWCKVLGLCGYAGVEEAERYEMSLTRIIHTYKLYQFDKK